ncbi:3061_t:CDS:2 [Dentiscutata heterogama]|uniref:3061_t:CDS:1 n=1 Tax=Dentiscutata heterogama TaxID=1316150 RepID=A0ACA9JYH4_9GLOM|nr:3061_t:CDS:2 [Dentiscutata heterogama]
MCTNEHEAIVALMCQFFSAHSPISSNAPIQIRGQPLHGSPAGDGTRIAPDFAVFPHKTYVLNPPVPTLGNSYARIICEIAMAQTSSNLKNKCKLWMRQSYIRSIKLYDIMNTRAMKIEYVR